MPFGIHTGKQMQDVPADYLAYLRRDGCKHPRVAAYIEWAWKAIEIELNGRRILRNR